MQSNNSVTFNAGEEAERMSRQGDEDMTKQRVLRVDQSPMNPVIWILELACGHDVTVTQKARPSTMRTFTDKATGDRMTDYKMVECWRCKDAQKGHSR